MPTYLDWPLEETPSAAEEYDRYAGVYDLLFGARGADVDFYVSAARALLPPGGRILELGTGTGRVAESMALAGFFVVGVDISREMLARAEQRRERLGERFETVLGDVRLMALGRRFPLIIAPFGMMAHLLTEEDRRATMRAVFDHLEPGGVFLFDDMPTWLGGASNGEKLETLRTAIDPESQQRVRLMTMAVDIDAEPITLCYHFIDWLEGSRLSRRLVMRVLFRNTSLDDELRWLGEAGFEGVELVGGFDGRPFDRVNLAENLRLIVRCRRPA